MSKKRLLLIVLLLLVVGGITVIYWWLNPNDQSLEKPKIATTIFPLYDIVRNVAGNKLETIVVLKPGASPHTFDATVEDLKSITGSGVIFAVGYGVDDWVTNMAQSVGVKRVVVVDKNITLRQTGNSVDPHYWLTIPNALLIAGQVQKELATLYPQYKSAFESNYIRFALTLAFTDQQLQTELDELSNRQIATFHSAWSYFAQVYELDIVTTFEEFPGKEPTPAYLASFQDKIRQYEIQVIFSEPQFFVSSLQPIASDLGVTIKVLDPIGGVEGRTSYQDLMRYNVSQIIKALK